MVTPSRIFAPAPSQTPAPIVTPADFRPCAMTGVGELDIAVLARQDGVAAHEHPVTDPDAAIRLAFRVQQAVVVDDDVGPDLDLVRMPQHHVLAEDDVAAARA